MPTAPKRADNIKTRVIDLVRPHIHSGNCLIVTGFSDLLSSLRIILDVLGPVLMDSDQLSRPHIRLVYGVDTANTSAFRGSRSVQDNIREHFLHEQGLVVEDAADLKAVLAVKAIEQREIDIRAWDSTKSARKFDFAASRNLHAKMVVSPIGAIAGSANFSYAGLYRNVEYTDELPFETKSEEIAAGARQRAAFAEEIWDASEDCNEAVLDGLRKLLRTVTPEEATARCIAEQRGLPTWRIDLLGKLNISKLELFPYQLDLVYEAAHAVYEYGIVFLNAPAGSGKTQIAKHLAYVLSRTFRNVIHEDRSSNVERTGTVAIVPPRVYQRWYRDRRLYQCIRNSRLESPKNIDLLKSRGVHIVDESHTVLPRLAKVSNRAKVFEASPPAWTVCQSATPIGNYDVDWLLHALEKRASIFMSPDHVTSVQKMIQRIGLTEESIFDMPVTEQNPLAIGSDSCIDEGFLPPPVRDWAVKLLGPYMVLRTRADIGEQETGKYKVAGRFPRLVFKGRHPKTKLTDRQRAKVDEIAEKLGEIPGLPKQLRRDITRLGDVGRRALPEDALPARNLLNMLRMCPAAAKWEMEHGKSGQALRRIENKDPEKRSRGQGDLFTGYDTVPPHPTCDKILELLAAPAIQNLNEKLIKAMKQIQDGHNRVVFLAERVLPLVYFAERLKREGVHENVCLIASDSDSKKDTEDGHSTALEYMLDVKETSFKRYFKGDQIEPLFSQNGRKRIKGRMSVFMTYQMAEGVNLQSCDTLVCISVASSMVQLVQGLGRVDRIDSPFRTIYYYVVDIPTSPITSDELAEQRLASNRALTARGMTNAERRPIKEADDPSLEMCENALDFIRERGRLRDTNYHDILRSVRGNLSPDRYASVSKGVDRPNGIQGMWGAQLALLSEGLGLTVFNLRGRKDKNELWPPRLLAVDGSGRVFQNQVDCARKLDLAYRETMRRGEHDTSPSMASLDEALVQIEHALPRLKEWHLRPERTVAGLRALVRFLWPDSGDDENADENYLGDLSLSALESLFETWTRLLDPAWKRVKERVRIALQAGTVPGYTSYQEILEELQGPIEEESIRERMTEMHHQLMARSRQDPDRVTSRISVVFVSTGPIGKEPIGSR